MIGQCKLCLKDESKLCKSHIIPEFAYSSMYDHKGRAYLLEEGDSSTQKSSIKYSTKKQAGFKFRQNGYKEHLLCKGCETHISKFEKYAKYILESLPEKLTHLAGKYYKYEIDNVASFRLFSLSILWRASISNGDMFRDIKLGVHEDKIRLMILNENPSPYTKYQFCFSPIIKNGERVKDIITSPDKYKNNGNRHYRFIFNGYIFSFSVGSNREVIMDKVSPSINGDGITFFSSFDSIELFKDTMDIFRENGVLTRLNKTLAKKATYI